MSRLSVGYIAWNSPCRTLRATSQGASQTDTWENLLYSLPGGCLWEEGFRLRVKRWYG